MCHFFCFATQFHFRKCNIHVQSYKYITYLLANLKNQFNSLEIVVCSGKEFSNRYVANIYNLYIVGYIIKLELSRALNPMH